MSTQKQCHGTNTVSLQATHTHTHANTPDFHSNSIDWIDRPDIVCLPRKLSTKLYLTWINATHHIIALVVSSNQIIHWYGYLYWIGTVEFNEKKHVFVCTDKHLLLESLGHIVLLYFVVSSCSHYIYQSNEIKYKTPSMCLPILPKIEFPCVWCAQLYGFIVFTCKNRQPSVVSRIQFYEFWITLSTAIDWRTHKLWPMSHIIHDDDDDTYQFVFDIIFNYWYFGSEIRIDIKLNEMYTLEV